MGQRTITTDANHQSVGRVKPLPRQPNRHNDIGDWRRTIGVFGQREPFSQHHRAGPAPANSGTPASPGPARASDPDDHTNSGTGAEDVGAESESCTKVGSHESVESGSMSSMTSVDGDTEATQVENHHATIKAFNGQECGEIGHFKNAAYPQRLRDSRRQLADESGANYQTLLNTYHAVTVAPLAMSDDSDAEESDVQSSIGGDSGYGADTESGADDEDESERRRRSDAPPPQS